MASQINASNSGFGGIVSTGDSSGVLQLQAAGTTIATIQSTGLNLGSNGVVFSDSSSQTAAASPYVLKNRIINGAMVIDQRNAGASVTPANGGADYIYTLDRWRVFSIANSKFSVQQNAGSVTPPAGFTNYLGITSLAATSVGSTDLYLLNQRIEGFNFADLNWGTANAQTVTLSFRVYSSLTGTFGGALQNSAVNRTYPFTYTISSANTWTTISVTIAGDTSGTWIGATNGAGCSVQFSLGAGSTYMGTAGAWASAAYFSATGATSVVGTNGATFYITGVQLEVGTSATPFERRLYNQELANCQRYCFVQSGGGNKRHFVSGNVSGTTAFPTTKFPVTMRTGPSLTISSAGHFTFETYTSSTQTCTGISTNTSTSDEMTVAVSVASSLATGGNVLGSNASAQVIFSAEL